MSQELSNQTKPSALALMAGRLNVDPNKLLSTLKNTVFKGASDDELLALVVISNEYKLNPMLKEIYAYPSKGGVTPVVSVDGWNKLANSHPQMDGIEFDFDHDAAGKLLSCTCTVWRKDRSKPVKVTEYLSECRRSTEPWKMEHRMLRHKALIQGTRVAFGFSGIVDEDEVPNLRDVTPAKIPSVSFLPEKQAAPAIEQDSPKGVIERINDAGLKWGDVGKVAEANGILVLPKPWADQPDEIKAEVEEVLEALISQAKEGK
jgi:hypothetical protein